ncbi:hypothetical protein B0H67DRAFT_480443 [Lasiosphaeris hirsuta]|uniref:Uncharacterized protein n=1 Tax=Lasiosphaeris hirsuta TaxID=260670 RepID=A0AA40AYK5_9PEZI|nr:hypothetical protein B0H67DRAFT_480443 [Lasiosphaeris hirsuta]
MASLSQSRLQEELVRLVTTHPTDAELRPARSALMWLSVAQRPLRAHELWVALQVEESKDMEHIERLLTHPSYADEAKAASALQSLLGTLITATPDPSSSAVFISLRDPSLSTFLNHIESANPNPPARILQLAFSTSQAHIFAASICMAICAATPLHLAHVHSPATAGGLVLYGWAHWRAHLALSGYGLDNANAAGLANSMIFGVCADVLVFLLALNDFVTGPVTFAAGQGRTRAAALVRAVQEALERPIFVLAGVVQGQEYARTMQGARDIFEGSKFSGGGKGSGVPLVAAGSKVETLRIDGLLADTLPLFGDVERRVVKSFAEVARGLRALAMLVAQPALYDELRKEYAEGWSPLDILVNAADWMESVASYPYWHEISDSASSNPLVVTDTSDPNYDTALLVLSRARKDGTAPAASRRSEAAESQLAARANVPLKLSPLRWKAASALDKVRALREPTSGATFTLNDPRFLQQRTWSFATFPSEMQGSSDVSYLTPFIPSALRRFFRRRIIPLLKPVLSSGIWDSVDAFASGAFTVGLSNAWPSIKSGLLSAGYPAALFYFLCAILLNHIRRILFPWLNAYMWYDPMEDLRLALSNPDAFLSKTLSTSYGWMAFSYAQKWVTDIVTAIAVGLIISNNGNIPAESLASLGPNPDPTVFALVSRMMDAAKIGYMAWIFSSIEYIFARTVNTFAFVAAYYKLLSGGDAEYVVLGQILKQHWPMVLFTGFQLFSYIRHGLWTLLWSSVVCALAGQPGLLLVFAGVAGGVTAVIKWRSVFFMALEVSGVFIAAGFLVSAVVLLGVEFVEDPLGLQASTAVARKRGARARAVLPRGAGGRVGILSRKGAAPVIRRGVTVEEVEGSDI